MYSNRCNHPRLLVYCTDPVLNQAIETWAKTNGVMVLYASHSPDLLATNCFACIVDRTVMGADNWALYLDFVAEVDGGVMEYRGKVMVSTVDTRILIIDDLNLPIPKTIHQTCLRITPWTDKIRGLQQALDDALKSRP